MIGRNAVTLNHATVCAALQMYLNSERKADAAPLQVRKVEQLQRHNTTDFTIETESPVPEPTP